MHVEVVFNSQSKTLPDRIASTNLLVPFGMLFLIDHPLPLLPLFSEFFPASHEAMKMKMKNIVCAGSHSMKRTNTEITTRLDSFVYMYTYSVSSGFCSLKICRGAISYRSVVPWHYCGS